jgi:hypothetical protein
MDSSSFYWTPFLGFMLKLSSTEIETLKDNTISHGLQTLMLSRVSVNKRYQLDTSHSPFFSQPDKLAAILLGL